MLCYGVRRVAIVPSAEESRGWGLGAQQPQPLTVCPLPPLGLGQTSQQGVLGGLSIQHVWLSPDTWSLSPALTTVVRLSLALYLARSSRTSPPVVWEDISIRGVGWVHHSPAGDGSPLPSTLHHYCWDNGRDKYWMFWGLGGQGVGVLLSPNK